MKKLLTFASVIALAVAFGLAGAASAGRPEGVGGGPPGGGESESLSYFSSPLIALGFCNSASPPTCISGNIGLSCSSHAECDVEVTSRVEINSRGDWSVMTEALPPGTDVQICLDAESAPYGVSLPLLLTPSDMDADTDADGDLNEFGGYTDNDGHWRGPRFQIRADKVSMDCDGDVLQESGISLDGSGVSKMSAPFVALDYGSGDVTVTGEVESTAQIDRNGNWILYTTGLQRKQRYDICLVGMHDGMEEVPPLFLSDLTSQPSGKLYAKGNAVDYGGRGIWTEVRFQIRIEPYDYAPNCWEPPVQESGFTIRLYD